MIVRESNRTTAGTSPAKWPPKSPFEALQSSPRGRKKIEEARERFNNLADDEPEDDEEDEDEETLQLQLQAIEAKLKLKKLQAAKARRQDAESPRLGQHEGCSISQPTSRPSTVVSLRREQSSTSTSSTLAQDAGSIRSRSFIQVPLSPAKKLPPPAEALSPARRLGIDKGLRAENVSLKRAPSSKFGSMTSARSGTALARSRPTATKSALATEEPRKSFSERIAEVRRNEKSKEDRDARFERARSQGFGLRQLLENGDPGESSPNIQKTPVSASRPHTTATPLGFADLPRDAASVPPIRLGQSTPADTDPFASLADASSPQDNASNAPSEPQTADESSTFDPFTSLHLSRRLTPHPTVQRLLTPHTTFTIPQLLKTVKGPDFDPPDCPSASYVVLAVVGKKSAPQEHKKRGGTGPSAGGGEAPNRSKFMVLNLCDMKWEIDLYLFGAAFTKWWKLTPGTVIAILNPDILPPLPHRKDTNAFSLKLGGDEDTVIEIGTARDLSWCESRKSDGQLCGSWIDKRKTKYCEFHINLQVDKARRGRMEVNGMSRGERLLRSINQRGRGGHSGYGSGASRNTGLLPGGKIHDRETGTTIYMAPGMGGGSSVATRGRAKKDDSHATVFEDPFIGTLTSYTDRGPSKEALAQKRKVARDKERALAASLGALGTGMGSEYLRMREPGAAAAHGGEAMMAAEPAAAATDNPDRADAEALGLLGNKASEIRLSPGKGKRKRLDTSEPMGWGGAKKRDWLDAARPAPPAAKPAATPPGEEMSPRKRARFLLERKGIRMPGRESLGVPGTNADDDDDDLEIV